MKGPHYGVELIDLLPIDGGQMHQAMPSANDLKRCNIARIAAGYEVLLGHWHRQNAANAELSRRYDAALHMLARMVEAYYKESWADGETMKEVTSEASDLLEFERLSKKLEAEK